MSVLVHMEIAEPTPVMVFSEATDYQVTQLPSGESVVVVIVDASDADGGETTTKVIATVRRWASVAIVTDETAMAVCGILPCKRCADRGALLREAVAARASAPSDG